MTINYPALAFAFNPIIIEVLGLTEPVRIIAEGVTLEREQKNGKAVFDLQAIVQSLFNRKDFYKVPPTDTILLKRVSFEVRSGGDVESASFDVIWGALQIGEVFSQTKTLTWFKNLPFTFPLYLSEAKQVLRRYDQNRYKEIGIHQKGKYSLRIPVNATERVVFRVNAGNEGGVFDYTFDYTFRAISKDTIIITLLVNECTNGIYLRWINKHGEYCYYLFNQGITSDDVRNSDIELNEFLTTIDYVDGYHLGTNKALLKEAQKSTRLYAPLVNDDTHKFLASMVESPVVDLYRGKDDNGNDIWISVNIAPGTTTRDKSPLQDFECSLIFPKTFTQSL